MTETILCVEKLQKYDFPLCWFHPQNTCRIPETCVSFFTVNLNETLLFVTITNLDLVLTSCKIA